MGTPIHELQIICRIKGIKKNPKRRLQICGRPHPFSYVPNYLSLEKSNFSKQKNGEPPHNIFVGEVDCLENDG